MQVICANNLWKHTESRNESCGVSIGIECIHDDVEVSLQGQQK